MTPPSRSHLHDYRRPSLACRSLSITLNHDLLHDHLPIHPRMRRADVVVDARLAERDGLRLAFGEPAGRPLTDRHCGRIVRNVADIAERHGGAGLDPPPRRRKAIP